MHDWAIGCIAMVAPGCPYWQPEKIFDDHVIMIRGAVPGTSVGEREGGVGRVGANSIPLKDRFN